MKSIGLIGIGQMGMPMGKNLLRAGYNLTVYARRVGVALPLLELGAKLVKSPKLVSENSEAIVLALPAPQDVIEIIFGNEAITSGLTPGKTIIDTSTIDPKSSIEIAKRLDMIDADYLDSPVSGGPEGATKALLTFMVGGRKEDFERCSGSLQSTGQEHLLYGRIWFWHRGKARQPASCFFQHSGECGGDATCPRTGSRFPADNRCNFYQCWRLFCIPKSLSKNS
jgi:2-hydroxy-3-oxopropionate reductase